jgi:ribA/ribD-fused uncharacterized protein
MSESASKLGVRRYRRGAAVVFRKTKDAFGGLSNMAAGYPLLVEGVNLLTSEALYQACRFPHRPEVQQLIIEQASPMSAKMKSKPYRKESRPDWDRVNVAVMRWCLRVKLAQHWDRFGDLLRSTGDLPIVEESGRDQFWGAKPVDEATLVGASVLGRLLMELRQDLLRSDAGQLRTVEPLSIPQFLLYGRQIGIVRAACAELPAPDDERGEEPHEGQLGLQGF